MSLIFRMVVAASLLAILGQPSVHASPGRNKDKEEKLIAKIERENNPGKKARLQLRLAKLNLREADRAYHARDFAEGKALLRQYLGSVKDSWTTLQAADNGARKHLRAFKDLEISLREDDRFLEDLSHRVPYPESETIKEIAKESSAIHNQVLEAIFPGGISPRGRGKRLMPPRSAMPGRLGAVQS
jgi:hypothetical protein